MPASLKSVATLVFLIAIANCTACLANDDPTLAQRPAKQAFGAVKTSVPGAPRSIGKYDLGCIAGAKALPLSGPGWQVMRVSRNRRWGHPELLAFLRKLAADATGDGWPGLLVGDMAQPVGGPLLGGHASHQIGLDADLWYKPMPDHRLTPEEREKLAPDNVVDQVALTVAANVWVEAHVKLLRRAASYPEVARIFVHPAVKKALCTAAGDDRAWLRKIRPWYKHDDHFHIRLNCPEDSPACKAQAEIASDDGCGAELDNWFKKLRAPPPPKPSKPSPPAKPLLVSDMPPECQALLAQAEQLGTGKSATASEVGSSASNRN